MVNKYVITIVAVLLSVSIYSGEISINEIIEYKKLGVSEESIKKEVLENSFAEEVTIEDLLLLKEEGFTENFINFLLSMGKESGDVVSYIERTMNVKVTTDKSKMKKRGGSTSKVMGGILKLLFLDSNFAPIHFNRPDFFQDAFVKDGEVDKLKILKTIVEAQSYEQYKLNDSRSYIGTTAKIIDYNYPWKKYSLQDNAYSFLDSFVIPDKAKYMLCFHCVYFFRKMYCMESIPGTLNPINRCTSKKSAEKRLNCILDQAVLLPADHDTIGLKLVNVKYRHKFWSNYHSNKQKMLRELEEIYQTTYPTYVPKIVLE